MFDQQSRDHLKECGFYEGYVIREILEVQELAAGKVSDQHYTILDNGSCVVSLHFTDHTGAAYAAEFASKLTPLILASGFKTLDQVWEWILGENSHQPSGYFWTFKGKYDCITTKSITYPDFLATETIFQSVIKNLFIHFWPRRNAIVHSSWGQIVGRDLNFDFTYPDMTQAGKPVVAIQETIKFNDIVNFADFSHQLFLALIDQSNQTTDRINALKILADKLILFHNSGSFGAKQHRVFIVNRITSQDKISIKGIRTILDDSACSQPYFFLLTITEERTNKKWEIPSENLEGIDEVETKNLGNYT
jgi:hypothetical protein